MFFANFSEEWSSPALWVLPGYYIIFAVLIFASENDIKSINTYCKFLTVNLGKGLFHLYMGTLLLYYRDTIGHWDTWPTMVLVAAIIFYCMSALFIAYHFIGKEKVHSKLEGLEEQLVNS
jgi:hypothetical protein